jgi:hypothetical protein
MAERIIIPSSDPLVTTLETINGTWQDLARIRASLLRTESLIAQSRSMLRPDAAEISMSQNVRLL